MGYFFTVTNKVAAYIEKTTNDAAKIFGINSNAVGYVVADDESETRLCSIFKGMKNKQIKKDPLKRAKSLPITEKVEIWHLSDYESSKNMDEYKHEANFKRCLKQLTL